MRKASTSLHLLVASLLVCASFVTAEAQSREKFVISAKAGGINAVSGRTGVQPQGSSEWEQLTIKDNLEAGDMVKTGIDGRVEMLLNPGAYLRVGENSEFELTNNSLDNLEVRLIKGTAIVEATGTENTELMINITTPHTKMAIVRRGLYRVNVVPGDATELIVRKGRVLLSDSQIKVKGGRKLIFSGHTFSMAKLEKADKEKDALENWSKERAETVAKANRRISHRDLNMALASFGNGWFSRGFASGSSGVWVFNPRFQCYTFLPYYFGWGRRTAALTPIPSMGTVMGVAASDRTEVGGRGPRMQEQPEEQHLIRRITAIHLASTIHLPHVIHLLRTIRRRPESLRHL